MAKHTVLVPGEKYTIGKLKEARRSGKYVEGANFYPRELELFQDDPAALIREYVLPGHLPAEPLLEMSDNVVTLGSCFASHLRSYLQQAGCSSDNFWIPEHLTTTHAMLDFISWCVTGQETDRGFRYEIDLAETSHDQIEILEYLRNAAAYILTFGLTEIWEDRETGHVFWRGMPKEILNHDRHVFRVTTAEENESNIVAMIDLIRKVSPEAPIVLTLSPVPLKATFREISCVAADCLSKATLRLAIDSVMSKHYPSVYYWPSFEIVRWLGAHQSQPSFGIGVQDARHVNAELVAQIIDLFVESFYRPAQDGTSARAVREEPAAPDVLAISPD